MDIKENIIKAKAILGEKSAYIISEDLKIENWDEKNLKGNCPFHEEKTPSFVWNKENHYFKCFGCGRVYGIVDHYQHLGMSYKNSVAKLFSEAGLKATVDLDFKDKQFFKGYRYPKEEKNTDRGKVEKYLKKRKISKETLDYADIKQDLNGNIVFEHRGTTGELLATKYRPSRKVKKSQPKMWWQKDADMCPVLYGVDKIDITQPLLIVEGHLDRLACIESGFKNVVSIPVGANSYNWIEFNWEWLENFDKIIIWSDNDTAGEKMKKEIIPRLGEFRCYVVKIPEDLLEKTTDKKCDANIILYDFGKQEVLNLVNNSSEVPVEDLVDLMKCKDFDLSEMEQISTGFNALDRRIFSHIMGSFNIWTGYTGHGKSTILNQSCISEPLEENHNVFLFSGELMKSQLKNWVLLPLAGQSHIMEIDNGEYKPKSYKITDKAKRKMEKYYEGKILLYDNFLKTKPEDILAKMEYLYKKKGTKVFIIDNLMCITFEGNDDKYDAQKNFIIKLVNFVNKYGVIVHLVAHPKKPNGITPLTEYDIFGSSNIPNLTHRIFSVRRVSQKEKEGITNKAGDYIEEPIPYDSLLTVLKDRITGAKDYVVGLNFDEKTKRFYGNSDNLYRKYSWDDTNIEYDEKTQSILVCNNRDDSEVFGEVK